MRTARLLAYGWLFHFKMLARSSFNGVLGLVYLLIRIRRVRWTALATYVVAVALQ